MPVHIQTTPTSFPNLPSVRKHVAAFAGESMDRSVGEPVALEPANSVVMVFGPWIAMEAAP